MERLSAEYLTLATEAQAERWDALLVAFRAHTEPTSTPSVQARRTVRCSRHSAKPSPLAWISRRPSRNWSPAGPCADAIDVAAVLHGRVHRWIQAASGRRQGADHLIAGLIPRVRGVTDPDMASRIDRA